MPVAFFVCSLPLPAFLAISAFSVLCSTKEKSKDLRKEFPATGIKLKEVPRAYRKAFRRKEEQRAVPVLLKRQALQEMCRTAPFRFRPLLLYSPRRFFLHRLPILFRFPSLWNESVPEGTAFPPSKGVLSSPREFRKSDPDSTTLKHFHNDTPPFPILPSSGHRTSTSPKNPFPKSFD